MNVRLSFGDCLMLSEALSQFIENRADVDNESDRPMPDQINLALASRLLDVVDTVVSEAAQE